MTARLAGKDDLAQVGRIIADAFHHHNPVDAWLFPDPEVRRAVSPAFFAFIAEGALTGGTVYLTDEGAAVWFTVDGPGQAAEPPPELLDLVGEATGRMAELDDAFASAHQDLAPHDHLELLGVVPGAQGRGVGAALLAEHHRQLDERGRAAYLDAASLDSRRLYLRHGYQDHGEPFRVGRGGPLMYPMWRPPGR